MKQIPQNNVHRVTYVKLINQHFSNNEIVYTQYKGHATLLAQDALKKKRECIIVIGGDWSISECANAIIGTKTQLGIIPAGSGNGFALHFGISTKTKRVIWAS